MQFLIAATARTTGNMLKELVERMAQEQDVTLGDAVVSYGVGYSGSLPVLNGNCGVMDKLVQAIALRNGLGNGALEVIFEDNIEEYCSRPVFYPLLSRKLCHSRGRDIGVVLEPWQLSARLISGANFFTRYENSNREFRVWTYRNRFLGAYEKVFRRPEDFTRLGRNHGNGFDFSKMDSETVPQSLKDISRNAIATINLDFGATDIIQRPDGSYCVLEVNTAPGVSDERRAVIQSLAKRIVRWAANGYPNRHSTDRG